MHALEFGEEGAPGEDSGGKPGRGDVAGTIAAVDDDIAEVAEGAGVGELEAILELDAARAVVAHPPAVGEGGAAGVANETMEAMRIEHGVDVEVEPVADDDGLPVVPVGPIDELKEPGAEVRHLEGEGAQRGLVGFDEIEGCGIVLLDGELARAEAGLEFAPGGGGEALEELARGIVEDDGVIEVEADDAGHGSSFARRRRWRRQKVNVERARYLVSAAGRSDLAALPPALEGEEPARLTLALRRRFPAEQAAALAEQVTLRARARARFGAVPLALFTAEGLEMMTHPLVATRRAGRLARLGLPVADLTCGIGGDLHAVAAAGVVALGLERDATTALVAEANVPGRVAMGDAQAPPCRLEAMAVILDPGRRTGAGRTFDPAQFSPPWDRCVELAARAAAAVIKAPPGLELGLIPADGEMEAVQVGRQLRELTVWRGGDARPGIRRAVLLPSDVSLDSTAPASDAVHARPGRFFFDPEPCVTRAGLVQQLAAMLGAHQMDARVAYLAGDTPVRHPLCATFRVLEVMPFGLKRLREHLRSHGLRPREIRRRAFPVEPDELRGALGRLEGEPVDLALATLGGERLVFLLEQLPADAAVAG